MMHGVCYPAAREHYTLALFHSMPAHPTHSSLALIVVPSGSTVNARDHRKRTPLHLAAEEGEKEVIAFLLDKKADTNITDVERNTPLDLAAEKRHEEAVNILLKHSAPSTKDSAVIRTLEKAMASGTGIRDDLVAEKIKEMSRFGYACRIYLLY